MFDNTVESIGKKWRVVESSREMFEHSQNFHSAFLFLLGVVERSRKQGWHQEFSDGGLTLPMRGLKYGLQGTINAKNLRKNCFSRSEGGLACSDGGL